ncbi:MAG: alanine/ornithine racemase family PLP-dependent enzyme [Firmicutes bacterium]|nr:alanine/ornithine racemase family PLP-dependent enzyme [Bacillota bacterium]
MYPRLLIDLNKIEKNLDTVAEKVKGAGCSLMIVTKSFCADEKIIEKILAHPQVDFLADSRIQNIKTYAGKGTQTLLLRLPQACEAEDVVRYADVSLNSEPETLRILNEEAGKQGKVHKVVLMIDLGDLREGIWFEEEETIFQTVEQILASENLELYGVGTNLTCYGAIVPKFDNLSVLTGWAKRIEEKYGVKLPVVSGGNSSSLYLIDKGELPAGVSNLRIGEAFILARETAYGELLPGAFEDAVTLEAQIVELKTKRSLPVGEVGMDAFGQVPYYEDRGMIKRAILAVGKQDMDPDGLTPTDPQVEILGASSDHLILDVTKADKEYKVGDTLTFTLAYGALLRAFTSAYIHRSYQ